jgi:hypothetical protein
VCVIKRDKISVVSIDVEGVKKGSHLFNFRRKGGSEGDITPGVDERYGHSLPNQASFPFLFLFPER